jgi:predicted nucleotidyltransferase
LSAYPKTKKPAKKRLKKPMPKAVEQRISPDAVAQQIAQRYPGADAVFLAGSIVRGEGTATSDLDIVVVTSYDKQAPYRESLLLAQWPVELFVHTPESLERFFQKDIADRSPSLPQMCIEGTVIASVHEAGERIKARAQALLDQGPPVLSEADILQYRYILSDLLSDLEGSVLAIETPFILQRLLTVAIAAYLAHHRAWSGQGKWLWRALLRANPSVADQLAEALQDAESTSAIKRWVENKVLTPLGGPLFEGYYLSASDSD